MHLGQKTILIVEDDFLNRRMIKKILLDKYYRMLESKNQEEAIECLTQQHIDFAILDINLGDSDRDGVYLRIPLKLRSSTKSLW